MAIDPTDPETFENETGTTDEAPLYDPEVPEADAVEQHTVVVQEDDDPAPRIDPDSANEADSAEQARVVALDEDDYRP